MLDIKFIRENPEKVKKAVQEKCLKVDIDRILTLDAQIISLKQSIENELQKRNSLSKEMPSASPERREEIKQLSRQSGESASEISEKIKPLEEELKALMYQTPTIPAPDSPIGTSDADNIVIKQVGEKPSFDFPPLDHFDLLEKNDWGEFKKIPVICGTRSVGIKGNLLKLEIALWQFMLDKLSAKGFTPIRVPALVYEQALFNMGQFPSDVESVYACEKDNQYLAGTAEVVLNSLHAGEILSESDLPIKYAGFSPCFRREAGSAGRDTRGIFRVHEFFKVEQYILCKADLAESEKMHALLLENTEELLKDLEIPYQVVSCCTGDMGVGKYRMYDVESWCPAQNRYRETHSCSMLLDWQARRTNIRYRSAKTGKVEFVHTLNNTGIATPRILVALVENHQQKDGHIRLPKAIIPYMNGLEVL